MNSALAAGERHYLAEPNICEDCMEQAPTAPDGLCDDCAADRHHEAEEAGR